MVKKVKPPKKLIRLSDTTSWDEDYLKNYSPEELVRLKKLVLTELELRERKVEID